jgi:hypothetical protein
MLSKIFTATYLIGGEEHSYSESQADRADYKCITGSIIHVLQLFSYLMQDLVFLLSAMIGREAERPWSVLHHRMTSRGLIAGNSGLLTSTDGSVAQGLLGDVKAELWLKMQCR